MNLKFRDSALCDLEEIWDFYEEQETGVGDYFLKCMEAEYFALERSAGVQRQKDGFYCFVTRSFHHLIYYRMEDKIPVVYAVIDGRRDPEFNRKKIQSL